MEVEFELTPEDLIAFQRYHRQNSPRDWSTVNPANILTGGVILVALVAVMMFYSLSDNLVAVPYMEMVQFVGLGAALTFFVMVLNGKLAVRRKIFLALKQGRNAAKAFARRRVSIDAEAIRMASDFSSAAYYWHGVDRFGSTLDYLFVYINTTTAVVVPARAFPDDRAFKNFAEAARRYYRTGGVVREPFADAKGIVAKRRPDETRLQP